MLLFTLTFKLLTVFMSKALDYLLQARPEAMKNYFGFLKEAGKHLDPKTRAIISVITKVDTQTEAGFRQYLKRALREGVSADEILDALLLAFPTLGLSKIVWAMDILQEMDMPEFQLDNLGLAPNWRDVISESVLQQGETVCCRAGGKTVYVYCDHEIIHVYGNRCPHQGTLLSEDNLDGCILTCPRHHWKFDLSSGECIENGDLPLPELDYKIENGRLYVYC